MQLKIIVASAALALLIVPTISSSNAASHANAFYTLPGAQKASLETYDAPTTGVRVSFSGEPAVLVDKDNGWIWVGDFDGVHRSKDGGVHWSTSVPPQLAGAFTDGFALAQDAYTGDLYASSTTGQWIAVDKSTDHGASWVQINRLASVGLPFADRPWLVTGPAPNEVTLVYNGNDGEGCMYSSDGGVTFLPGSTAELQTNSGSVQRDVFGNIYVHSSIADTVSMWKGPSACPQHVPGQPATFVTRNLPAAGPQILTQVAVPAATGTTVNGGHAYVAQPSVDSSAMKLVGIPDFKPFAQGAMKTITISDSTMKSNTFAAVAVKPDDSEIAVSWYAADTPGDPSASTYPASATWSVYAVRVTNFWTATPTVSAPVLVESGNYHGWYCMGGVSCTSGRDLSDYHMIAYGPDGKLHVVWGHETGANGSGAVDVRYTNLG